MCLKNKWNLMGSAKGIAGSNQQYMDSICNRREALAINKMRAIYLMLIALFFLKGFVNIHVTNYASWLMVDYAMRATSIIIAFKYYKGLDADFKNLGLCVPSVSQIAAWTLGLTAVVLAYDIISLNTIWTILPTTALRSAHAQASVPLFYFDLFIGLMLVSISEEIIAREMAFHFLKSFNRSTFQIILFSSCIFSFLHWTAPLPAVIDAFVAGLFFMAVRIRTGSIVPSICAHYFSNLLLYIY